MPASVPLRVIPGSSLALASPKSFLQTQIREFDSLLDGLPRGSITEVAGAPSSGRTSFLHRLLSIATRLGEYCSLIDSTRCFDPDSARACGTEMRRLCWVPCDGVTDKSRVEQAIKCTDLLIHAGGWGVIVLDLCDIQPPWIRRLPVSYWYRFRRAVEHTPAVLVVLTREPVVKACASLALDMNPAQPLWSGGHPDFRLLSTVRYSTVPKKPAFQQRPSFTARAIA